MTPDWQSLSFCRYALVLLVFVCLERCLSLCSSVQYLHSEAEYVGQSSPSSAKIPSSCSRRNAMYTTTDLTQTKGHRNSHLPPLCMSLFLCFCFSVSVSLSLSLSFSFPFSFSASVCLSICLSLSLSLTDTHPLFLSVLFSLSIGGWLYACLFVSLCGNLPVHVQLSTCMAVCLSVGSSIAFYVHLCVCLFLQYSLCFSFISADACLLML